MWPFTKTRKLPGVEQHPDGKVSFTLTDEEKAHVDEFFRMMVDSNEDTEEGAWYIRSDAKEAVTAWQLIDYARSQVVLAELADEGRVDKTLCLHKALAAAMKAGSIHPLPIYMFDTGCIFEMLEATAEARDMFRLFLESQRNFKGSDVDKFFLAQRDIEAAVRSAQERISQKPSME